MPGLHLAVGPRWVVVRWEDLDDAWLASSGPRVSWETRPTLAMPVSRSLPDDPLTRRPGRRARSIPGRRGFTPNLQADLRGLAHDPRQVADMVTRYRRRPADRDDLPEHDWTPR